ncbi:hypothetical protein HDU89_003860 [Geranomyces variabilis]|nr:hypothetical protein HDU89_003860 [Geranomyces variabilis]
MSNSLRHDVNTILAMSLFSAAVALGIANVIYVVRQDLFAPRVSRSVTTVISQFILLGSYGASLFNGISWCRGDIAGFNQGYHFSSSMVMLGSFLLANVVLGFLPAVQIRLMYDPRWNTLATFITRTVFGICFCGFVATTLAVGIHDLRNPPLTDSPLLDARSLLYTVWLAYGPLLACTVPVLVLRMIIGAKQRLAGINDALLEENGVRPVEILGEVQKKSILSLCVAGPMTIALAVSTAWPYSPLLDAFTTFYCSAFCSYFLFTIYIIRQVTQYTPAAGSMEPSSSTASPRMGLSGGRGGHNLPRRGSAYRDHTAEASEQQLADNEDCVEVEPYTAPVNVRLAAVGAVRRSRDFGEELGPPE